MLVCVSGTFFFHQSALLLLVVLRWDEPTQLVENSQDRRHNLLKQTDVSCRPMTTASTKIRRGVYSRQPQWKGRKSKYDIRVTAASEWKAYALLLLLLLGLMSCVKVDGKKFGGWLSFRMMMGFAIIREYGIFTTPFNQTVKGDVRCWMGWLVNRVKFGRFGYVRFRLGLVASFKFIVVYL